MDPSWVRALDKVGRQGQSVFLDGGPVAVREPRSLLGLLNLIWGYGVEG